ncbi:MAG: transposase [Dehalococcoidia bacterium]
MQQPTVFHPLLDEITARLPGLRPAQRDGQALWVYGVIEAQTGCESRVVNALAGGEQANTYRQYLREWLKDGADKAAPCATQVELAPCFPRLLRWLLDHWAGRDVVLAIDPTTLGDELTALVSSVLYRSRAIPVAWHILPGNQPGGFIAPLVALLQALQAGVPRGKRVVVLTDRGLWSPTLYRQIKAQRWHPVMRVQRAVQVWLRRGRCVAADTLTPRYNQAWVGRAIVHKERSRRLWVTVVVVWEPGHEQPWVLFTDLAPKVVGLRWYGLRMWIECGFRDLKHYGWDWEHTRRRDLTRVARHWLVLAVATLWVLAAGTAREDALRPDGEVPPQARTGKRLVSVFQLGLAALRAVFARRCRWPKLRFIPELWPTPGPDLEITYYAPGPPRNSPYLPI